MTKQSKNRILWIDSMKIFSCLLVVIGHLYMSMKSGGWISGDAVYYCFPIQTVYAFHVPLFFVCSGYLYQHKNVEYTLNSHINNIKNKALNLGIPYLSFTLLTLILKIIFSDFVNNQATPIIRTIFWEPIAPYWYLYTLFFICCFIPRQKDKNGLIVVFLISAVAKIVYIFVFWQISFPDIITKVVGNAVWFSFGMLLTYKKFWKVIINKLAMVICFFVGLILSIMFYRKCCDSDIVQFAVAIMFVYSFTCFFATIVRGLDGDIIYKINKYFMPVYLMHTIVAAGVRTLLLKIGITSLIVHFSLGLILSILIPIFLYEFALKKWWILFWIEPQKAIKIRKINLSLKY